MQEMCFIHQLPDKSLEGGIKLLDSLWWHISCQEIEGVWRVCAGEQILLKTTSEEAALSFIYGLALAHALLPPEILENLRQTIRP
jgi:hypothetical protein